MAYNAANPLIVQSDKSLLLEVNNDHYEEARNWLARFAELEKSPEHIHTYRITPLSLWNAAASGLTTEAIVGALEKYSKYDLPGNVRVDIYDYISRYGRVKLIMRDGALLLVSDDVPLIVEISRHKRMKPFIVKRVDDLTLQVDASQRGHVKHVLVQMGYPAEDLAGYVDGAELPFHLLPVTHSGQPFVLRQYQQQATEVFYAGGQASGVHAQPAGHLGVFVLAPGQVVFHDVGEQQPADCAVRYLKAHTQGMGHSVDASQAGIGQRHPGL